MAQTRGDAGGTAGKAIKSVPLGDRASPEEYADLVAFMRGKSQITVQAKRGILAQGWAPGDDMGETAETIELPVGCIARLHRTEGYMQNAPTLALFVADGTFDIVDDKDFEKAKPHAKIIQEFNETQTRKREARVIHGYDGHLAGLRARIEDMESKRSERIEHLTRSKRRTMPLESGHRLGRRFLTFGPIPVTLTLYSGRLSRRAVW